MKYLIGIDLDGTLLTTEKTISKFSKETIKKVIERGHIVVLATGRSYDGTINYYKELNLNTPMITYHGASVYFMDEEISTNYIDFSFIKELNEIMNDYLVSAIYNTNGAVYSQNHSDELELIFNGANSKNLFKFDIEKRIDNVVNIAVAIKNEKTEEFESFFKNKNIIARSWGAYNEIAFYDLHIKGINKASALKKVLSNYDLTANNLIIFGDGPNDTEMLAMTKNSVVMRNGSFEAKAFANDTTKYTNDDDGVAKHLNSLMQNGTL